MPPPAESARSPGFNPLIHDLVKIIFTLLVTGIIGGAITYYYQDRAQQKQQEAKELEGSRDSAVTFLRECGDILEHRKYLAYRCFLVFRDQTSSAAETEEAWKMYKDSVLAWNFKWNIYRALILNELGPEVQKRFYDAKADDIGKWENCSITGKLILFHEQLVAAHKQRLANQPIQDEKKILDNYNSLAEDCYNFYSLVIARIQEGRVGRRSWSEAEAK
jgi:hypothetical protein